jgi:hypothetical protein
MWPPTATKNVGKKEIESGFFRKMMELSWFVIGNNFNSKFCTLNKEK